MATDWAADIKEYVPDADDAVIAKLVSTYRLVLGSRDSAYVAASDPAELPGCARTSFGGSLA
jgi:hypothetical protein